MSTNSPIIFWQEPDTGLWQVTGYDKPMTTEQAEGVRMLLKMTDPDFNDFTINWQDPKHKTENGKDTN